MAFVYVLPSLPWPVLMASVFATLLALVGVLTEPGKRYAPALMVACVLAGVMVVISDEVCQAFPWILECWCRICA